MALVRERTGGASFVICYGATAHFGHSSPLFEVSWTYTIRQTLCGSPLNEWSARRRVRCLHNTQLMQENVYAFSGIRTCDPSIRAVAGLCLRFHGHRNWKLNYLVVTYYINEKKKKTMQIFLQFFYRYGMRRFRRGQIRMLLVQCGRSFEGFGPSQKESDGVVWAVEWNAGSYQTIALPMRLIPNRILQLMNVRFLRFAIVTSMCYDPIWA